MDSWWGCCTVLGLSSGVVQAAQLKSLLTPLGTGTQEVSCPCVVPSPSLSLFPHPTYTHTHVRGQDAPIKHMSLGKTQPHVKGLLMLGVGVGKVGSVGVQKYKKLAPTPQMSYVGPCVCTYTCEHTQVDHRSRALRCRGKNRARQGKFHVM